MSEGFKSGLGCFLFAVVALLAIGISLLRAAEGEPPPDQTILIDGPNGAPAIAAVATEDPDHRTPDERGEPAAGGGGEMSLAEALAICRTTYWRDMARGGAMFAALAADDKPVVAALCLSYRQGAQDMLRALHAPPNGGQGQ